MKILTGNSNIPLAKEISKNIGIELTNITVKRFSDDEVFVEIHENVRGQDAFVIQSTSTPANDNLMELLVCVDTLRRASAKHVTAVIPYFGYARQDRKVGPRTPISAKLVANLLTTAGVDRVLTTDLHAGQIQGFFDIPVDNLYAAPVLVADIKKRYKQQKLMVVSPDVGGVVRARYLAKNIDADLAIVDKRRDSENVSEVLNIIGDVKGRRCLIVDDIIDTAGTLCNAAEAPIKYGALSVSAYVSHGVLSGPATERINNSKLEELVVTDTIEPNTTVSSIKKIRSLSIAPLIAEAIRRISDHSSVSSLFDKNFGVTNVRSK